MMRSLTAALLTGVVTFALLSTPLLHAAIPHEHDHHGAAKWQSIHAVMRTSDAALLVAASIVLLLIAYVLLCSQKMPELIEVIALDKDRGKNLRSGINKSRRFR